MLYINCVILRGIGNDWFWSTRPSNILLSGALFALSMSTILATVWPASYPDGVYTIGLSYHPPYALPAFIWIYCLFWWLLQDAAKVFTYFLIEQYDLFHYNETGKLVLPASTLQYIHDHQETDMQNALNGNR